MSKLTLSLDQVLCERYFTEYRDITIFKKNGRIGCQIRVFLEVDANFVTLMSVKNRRDFYVKNNYFFFN